MGFLVVWDLIYCYPAVLALQALNEEASHLLFLFVCLYFASGYGIFRDFPCDIFKLFSDDECLAQDLYTRPQFVGPPLLLLSAKHVASYLAHFKMSVHFPSVRSVSTLQNPIVFHVEFVIISPSASQQTAAIKVCRIIFPGLALSIQILTSCHLGAKISAYTPLWSC